MTEIYSTKSVKLTPVVIQPKKLYPGLYMKNGNNVHVLTQEKIDWIMGAANEGQVLMSQPVEFYLTSEEKIEIGDEFLFYKYGDNKPDNKVYKRTKAEVKEGWMDADDIMSFDVETMSYHPVEESRCRKIIAKPNQIGLLHVLVSSGIDSGDYPSTEQEMHIPLTESEINEILSRDGNIQVETIEGANCGGSSCYKGCLSFKTDNTWCSGYYERLILIDEKVVLVDC